MLCCAVVLECSMSVIWQYCRYSYVWVATILLQLCVRRLLTLFMIGSFAHICVQCILVRCYDDECCNRFSMFAEIRCFHENYFRSHAIFFMTFVSLHFLPRFLRFNVQIRLQFHGHEFEMVWILLTSGCHKLTIFNVFVDSISSLALLDIWAFSLVRNACLSNILTVEWIPHTSLFYCMRDISSMAVFECTKIMIFRAATCDRWSDDPKYFVALFSEKKCIFVLLVTRRFMHFYFLYVERKCICVALASQLFMHLKFSLARYTMARASRQINLIPVRRHHMNS